MSQDLGLCFIVTFLNPEYGLCPLHKTVHPCVLEVKVWNYVNYTQIAKLMSYFGRLTSQCSCALLVSPVRWRSVKVM